MRFAFIIPALVLTLNSACGEKSEPGKRGKDLATPSPVPQNTPMESGRMKYAAICLGCHGQDGKGQPPFPKLAGTPATELAAMLKDYRAGKTRGPQSATMTPFAMPLTDTEIDAIASYLSTL